jgi:tRNA (guanine-N7-)-methyltransferase
LFSTEFLRVVNSRLVDGGQLKIVTDHHPYADWIVEGAGGTGFDIERRTVPPGLGTKFEKKWSAAGQQAFNELVFLKTTHVHSEEGRVEEMKIYFLDHMDPERVVFPEEAGPVSIQFKDYMFDFTSSRGMVQAIVTEDRRTQYLWIAVNRTAKGWCLQAAPGGGILPTTGVQRALELAHEAFVKSGTKS